jgi:thiosulfate/3-mercaptopyruvate sulfurtransferase
MRKWLLSFLFLVTGVMQAQKPARPEMLVTTEWLAAHLKDPKLVILQFADEKDFAAGHIPGAQAVPADRLYVRKDGLKSELPPVADLVKLFEELGVSNDSRVVIYTTDWPPLGPRVYFTLDYLGLGDNASILNGGLEKWKAESRPVSTAATRANPGKITPHPRPEIVATLADVKAATETSSGATIVDARPDRRYRQGHIPGAVSLYWENVVAPSNKNDLVDAGAIRHAYDSVGATAGKKLITYCEIGWQASHDYFTAKYLGYDVKMYDGSYDEWSEQKHMPVVTGDKPR